jgi:hypothetical protein
MGQLDTPEQHELPGAKSPRLRSRANRKNGNRLATKQFGKELPMRHSTPLKVFIPLSAPVIADLRFS